MVKLYVMEQNETIRKLLPPRVIDSFTSGINRIEKQPYLLLFPIIFDIFLWLGPNLSIEKLVLDLYSRFLSQASVLYNTANVDPQPLFDLQQILSDRLGGYDLFSVLSTLPVGIPGIFTNVNTNESPLGASQVITVSTIGNSLLITFLLVVLGILAGAFYLHALSPKPIEKHERSILYHFLHGFLFALVLFAVMAGFGFFSIIISSFFALVSPLFGQVVLLILFVFLLMLLLPAFFAFVPIFHCGQTFYQAIITCYQVVGFRLRYQINNKNTIIISPRIIPFSLSIFILYQGLNIVWLRLPDITSWWMLISIIGHAFVSTMIFIACFDFFIKMWEWRERISKITSTEIQQS